MPNALQRNTKTLPILTALLTMLMFYHKTVAHSIISPL
ncbi:Uncharacterised protein [uncultured Aggregatibacter sp.]|nr:Uncharacterised protein [uncultured Aggregatibacter sp.]